MKRKAKGGKMVKTAGRGGNDKWERQEKHRERKREPLWKEGQFRKEVS